MTNEDEVEARRRRPTVREQKAVVTVTPPPPDDPERDPFADTVPSSPTARQRDLVAKLRTALTDMIEQKDNAYSERNLVVAALAGLCSILGLRVGVGTDPHEPEWHVLFIDLPTGQVSWHFPERQYDLIKAFPPYPASWDGHNTAEKYVRLGAWLERYNR